MEGRGGGDESRRMTKKKNERENFAEKSFKGSSLEKNSCIDLPKYFPEILAIRTREQIGVKKLLWLKNMPSFLASVQSRCLFKTKTFKTNLFI